jgi:Fe-S-cluster containining protein
MNQAPPQAQFFETPLSAALLSPAVAAGQSAQTYWPGQGGATMLFSLLTLLETKDTRQSPKTCLQCGQCCESFGGHLQASRRDLARWREAGRDDLLSQTNRLGWLWVDPETQQLTFPCPHIDRSDPERVRCKIYQLRPDICRAYPTLAHSHRCLRGVFLSWWSTLCCGVLPEWVTVMDGLPLAA